MEASDPVNPPHTRLELSLSQREVWLDQRAWPQSAHLNIGGCAYLLGAFKLDLFKQALNRLVAEFDALRLVPQADGSQWLLAHFEPQLELIDISGQPEPKEVMRNWWQARMKVPFDLDGTPPWRFTLLHAHDELHGITIQFHHLIMDGWGTTQVIRRWSELYNAWDQGIEPPPCLTPTYVHFIEESNLYRNSEAFARDASYWQGQVSTLPAPLITRHQALPHSQFHQLPNAHLAVQQVPRADYTQLEQCAAGMNLTAFNFFLATLTLYFARVNQVTEVVLGIPTLNRGGRRFKNTPGMFVGVLALKLQVAPDMTVADLLANGAAALRGALRHPRYPLSELGRHLQLIRHGRDGLFDVLLSFERQDYDVHFGAATPLDSRQLFSGTARYPLGVTVCEFHPDQDLELILDASSACFTTGEAASLSRRLWHLTQTLMNSPSARVCDLSVLLPDEFRELVHGRHQHTVCHDVTQPFIALFEHQVALRPEAVALVWDGGSMNYATLDLRARQLGQHLCALGATRDSLVAMAMERSPDMVIAVLAIAKAGAAFLPLDPDAPVARLAGILKQSRAVSLLMAPHSQQRLAGLHPQSLLVDWPALSATATEPIDLLHARPQPGDLAYVLFTSGSTGQPKGVMVEHATLSRRLAWLSRAYGVDSQDRSAQATQLTFDPSLIELLLPLIHGASVALPAPGRVLPESLVAFAERHGVTIMAFVPSTLSRFLEAKHQHILLKLRVACCGGEILAPELAERFIAATGARLYNVYGPTETSIFATAWECRPHCTESSLPIGVAIDDSRIYVLDTCLQPLPAGGVGEIFIGGTAIARGYLNQPTLSQESFLNDPFVPGARMYRTGDRGWLDAEGYLHFTGRLDRQVKLRGYRIELGEIEAACLAVEGVDQAAAKLLESDGKTQLHVWIGSRSNLSAVHLQLALRTHLPDYMIPGGISVLHELAVNSVGKIELESLPEPALGPTGIPAGIPARAATPLERELLMCWERVLEARPISIHDNFFDLGGDSLAAVVILHEIEQRLNRKVPMYFLTEYPTIERLANLLNQNLVQPGLISPLLIKPGTHRPPIYLAASGHGDFLRFQNLARAFKETGDVYMLQPPMDHTVGSMTELARLYAQTITAQGLPAGFLAGFSVGGIAALETARELVQNGTPVRALILIDTIYPRVLVGGANLWRFLGWLVRRLHLHELSLNGRRLGALFNDPGLVAQIMAMRGYRPQAFDGTTLMISTSGLKRWDYWLFRPWRKLMPKRLTQLQVPGLHGSIFEQDNITELASSLSNIFVLSHDRPS